ncbi:hypothetical protein [Prescottella subtropica]|uniref:hypothetical protein n=1 Tax=Prescottella subtropica TaxID=2545757 RepID=UPI0010F6909A|nr:hypothetical protein [Prescottella subtropica]
MKRGAAALNRLLVLAAGLALAAVGAAALAWEQGVTTVRDTVGRVDRDRVTALPDQSWWTWALGATLAACLVLGVVVLAVDLTRRRTAAGTMLETSTDTPVAIDLGPIATGVATELAALPGVRRARGRAVSDRGLPTLQIVLDADPHADVPALLAAADRIAATTTAALGGAAVTDVAVRVLLHLDRADPAPTRTRDG